jgi:ankyrin
MPDRFKALLPLQAAQQGHSQIVNLLLEANASPNTTSNVSLQASPADRSLTLTLQTGQTALCIAQKLGYISVVETLKVVTDTVVTTTTTTTVEEKYKVLAPESMQETFMSDSEDEGGNSAMHSLILHSLTQ